MSIFDKKDVIQYIYNQLDTYNDYCSLMLVNKCCCKVGRLIRKISRHSKKIFSVLIGEDSYVPIPLEFHKNFDSFKDAFRFYTKLNRYIQQRMIYETDDDSEESYESEEWSDESFHNDHKDHNPIHICYSYPLYDKTFEILINPIKCYSRTSSQYLYYGYRKPQEKFYQQKGNMYYNTYYCYHMNRYIDCVGKNQYCEYEDIDKKFDTQIISWLSTRALKDLNLYRIYPKNLYLKKKTTPIIPREI